MEKARLNRTLYIVLRGGMVLSLVTMLLGLFLFVISPGYSEDPIAIEDLVPELSAGNPVAIIEIGILMLIATPFLRIMAALSVFAYEKDVKFVLISMLVLFVVILATTINV